MKLSGLGRIRAHIKAIKSIMEKFQKQSQQSSKYTVYTIQSYTNERVYSRGLLNLHRLYLRTQQKIDNSIIVRQGFVKFDHYRVSSC